MSTSELTPTIKRLAVEAGFQRVGIAPVDADLQAGSFAELG